MKMKTRKNKEKILRKKDQKKIRKVIRANGDARIVKRAMVLHMMDQGCPTRKIEKLVYVSDKTAKNILARYRRGGLNLALFDRPRSGQPKKFTAKKIQRITAIACSAPPAGYARWTLELLKEHVIKNGIADKVSIEEIRIILHSHELKPWQKKMWCVPKLNEEYIDRMEDVLAIYEKPYNKSEPVVCLDEKPVQLLDHARAPIAMKPGTPARQDYEYKRKGTANVFRAIEPKKGKHFTKVTENRKMPEFAAFVKSIIASYAEAKTIHFVMDNLSTHSEKALIEKFGKTEGRRLWGRLTVHYTPKHASWLNQAEIGIGIYAKQCLGKERVATIEELAERSKAWNQAANRKHIKINWTFTRKKARQKFNYKKGKD